MTSRMGMGCICVLSIACWAAWNPLGAQESPSGSEKKSDQQDERRPGQKAMGSRFCDCPHCQHARRMHRRHMGRMHGWQGDRPEMAESRGDDNEASPREIFLEIDASEDGKVTRDEILKQFDRLDANDDGSVTRQELREHLQELRETNMQAELEAEAEEVFDDILDEQDKNKDDKLSKDEASRRLWRQIAAADKNDDGITAEEFRTFHCAQMKGDDDAHDHEPAAEKKSAAASKKTDSP